ncbi:DUF4288 domain-containing protein [Candidatus Gracilibacteria bacterium]|nr:DUF4288 domain-containing protein [Candidatus Gracilibacteria bacterium]
MNKYIKQEWYSVKCIFGIYGKKTDKIWGYEERIILVRAKSFKEAVELAEKEARKYCEDYESNDKYFEYENFISVFHLFDGKICNFAEIYSLIRSSDLERDEFLDKYYDDGSEHSGEISPENTSK